MRHPSIILRLLLALLLVALTPLAGLQQSLTGIFTDALHTRIAANLAAIADHKEEQIDDIINHQVENASLLAQLPGASHAMHEVGRAFQVDGVSSPRYRQSRQSFLHGIDHAFELQGFYDLFLITPQGEVILTYKQEADLGANLLHGPYRNSQLAQVTRQALMVLETGISDFEWYAPSNAYAAFIATPVMEGSQVIGVLAVQIALDAIHQVVSDDSGLGQSGETVLAQRIGDHAVIVAPLRNDPGAAFRRELQVSDTQALPLLHGLAGKEGEGESVDYRKIPVLAAWRYLTRTGWAMVVKMDRSEAYAPVRHLQYLGLVLLAAAMFIAITFALWLGRAIVRPVKALTRTAVDIAEGHLDQRVEKLKDDEIGQLAVAFNRMADNLVHTQHELEEHRVNLEKTVKQRTIELQREVEEHERAEAKLVKYMAELEHSNRELDEFAYIAAHDLKEPLRGIHNYASFLQEDYYARLDAEGRNYLERMQRLAERQTALIDRLLAYSRIGRTELAVELADVDNILGNVAEDLKPFLESQRVELRRANKLPKVVCNPLRVGEILQNLIVNGAKYNDKAEKWVEVGCDENGDIPVFYVRDNGIGIAPQHQENVFRIFKRLHEQSRYGGGTGAGLTIVKKIIERHGGRIWLESAPGEGTTFYFILTGAA